MTCFSMGEHIYFQLEHIKTSHFSYSPVLAKRLENNLLVSLTSQESQQHLPWIQKTQNDWALRNWDNWDQCSDHPRPHFDLFSQRASRKETLTPTWSDWFSSSVHLYIIFVAFASVLLQIISKLIIETYDWILFLEPLYSSHFKLLN